MAKKRNRKNLGLCAICGHRDAVTRDHVPPKGIFCKPLPGNLIRVPACWACNNGASGLDERFRVFLGLQVGKNGGEAERFFREEAIASIQHNRKLRNEILANVEPVSLATPAGIIYDQGFRVLWDSKAHDAIIERTVRGLYFHHYGEVLGDRASVKVQWLRKLPREVVNLSKGWTLASLGKGEVIYKYGRAEESPLNSLWIFQFYGAHWASGYTTPVDVNPDKPQQLAAYRGG